MENRTMTNAEAHHITNKIVELLKKEVGLLNSLHVLKKTQEKIETLISES